MANVTRIIIEGLSFYHIIMTLLLLLMFDIVKYNVVGSIGMAI
jgi:hypothetical protein